MLSSLPGVNQYFIVALAVTPLAQVHIRCKRANYICGNLQPLMSHTHEQSLVYLHRHSDPKFCQVSDFLVCRYHRKHMVISMSIFSSLFNTWKTCHIVAW